MSNSSDDFDLISQMVNETLCSVEENTSSSLCVGEVISVAHSGLNINEFSEQPAPLQLEFEFNYFLGAYDSDRGCFIFQVLDQIIECPQNWGPFRFAIHNHGKYEDIFHLQKYEDIDFFFEIIEAIIGKSLKSLSCVNYGNHLKLTFKEDSEQKIAEIIKLDFSRQIPKAA